LLVICVVVVVVVVTVATQILFAAAIAVIFGVVVAAVVVNGVSVMFDIIVGVDVGVGAFARENGTILSEGNYPKEEEGEPR
jgi:hypothetical protein